MRIHSSNRGKVCGKNHKSHSFFDFEYGSFSGQNDYDGFGVGEEGFQPADFPDPAMDVVTFCDVAGHQGCRIQSFWADDYGYSISFHL